MRMVTLILFCLLFACGTNNENNDKNINQIIKADVSTGATTSDETYDPSDASTDSFSLTHPNNQVTYYKVSDYPELQGMTTKISDCLKSKELLASWDEDTMIIVVKTFICEPNDMIVCDEHSSTNIVGDEVYIDELYVNDGITLKHAIIHYFTQEFNENPISMECINY